MTNQCFSLIQNGVENESIMRIDTASSVAFGISKISEVRVQVKLGQSGEFLLDPTFPIAAHATSWSRSQWSEDEPEMVFWTGEIQRYTSTLKCRWVSVMIIFGVSLRKSVQCQTLHQRRWLFVHGVQVFPDQLHIEESSTIFLLDNSPLLRVEVCTGMAIGSHRLDCLLVHSVIQDGEELVD